MLVVMLMIGASPRLRKVNYGHPLEACLAWKKRVRDPEPGECEFENRIVMRHEKSDSGN